MIKSKSMKNMRMSTGFTVLELLVVVAIIAFLSSVSIVALSSSQSYKRDQQRKIDQLTIIKAVELYTNDFGVPPSQLCVQDDTGECIARTSYVPLQQSRLAQYQSIDPALLINNFFKVPTVLALVKPRPKNVGGGGEGTVCGNSICEVAGGETIISCPADCHCGNNICDYGETVASCALDCGCNYNTLCESLRGETIETCIEDCHCGNAQCEYSLYGETAENCTSDCGCNGNGICETSRGEDTYSCIQDCHCGNNICESSYGEDIITCPSDCTATDEPITCIVDGHLDRCCLAGGVGPACTDTGAAPLAGYYGVCNGEVCQQKYLLYEPAVTCDPENLSDCKPTFDFSEDKFVPSSNDSGERGNWLLGLDPYMTYIPDDPGHHTSEAYDHYYCSSHPDIVFNHRFCCWVSFERDADNFNPYNDITATPTGELDPHWTPLCVQ